MTNKILKAERKWHCFNANNQPLGRLATQVSLFLRGKHKTSFITYQDCGDHVVVINLNQVKLSCNKAEQKRYYSHSGYPGNLKTKTYQDIGPVKAFEKAVYGMLPKNKLREAWLKRLHLYEDENHPHQANLAAKEK